MTKERRRGRPQETCSGKDGDEGGERRSRWRTEEEETQREAATERGTQTALRAESVDQEDGEEKRNQHSEGVRGAGTQPEEGGEKEGD